LKNLTKDTIKITDFVYFVKARSDELAVLSAPMDIEDLTENILDGLDDEYKELVCAVQARDTASSFDELHEKLLSFEASLQAQSRSSSLGLVTANSMTRNSNNSNCDLHDLTGDHRSLLWGTTFVHQPPPTFGLPCPLLLQIMVATVDCLHVLI
jgi:hypothetical protein